MYLTINPQGFVSLSRPDCPPRLKTSPITSLKGGDFFFFLLGACFQKSPTLTCPPAGISADVITKTGVAQSALLPPPRALYRPRRSWAEELCPGSPGAAPASHIRKERKDAGRDPLPLQPPAGIFCDLHFWRKPLHQEKGGVKIVLLKSWGPQRISRAS